MEYSGLITDLYLYLFSFFGWRDILEISFFSSLFYYFSLWLSTDIKKNLVFMFYGYWAITFAAYFLQLTSIAHFLYMYAPVACLLFIIVHQEFLQRNFITLKNIIPATQQSPSDWITLLMRICLQTINKNKEIIILIEQKDSLQTLLTVPFSLETQLDETFLALLIDSPSYDQTKFIWLTNQGQLIGINATWKRNIHQEWFDKQVQRSEPWKQDALAITHKTDALFLGIDPLSRTFTLINQGKLIDQLQGVTTVRLIKKILASSSDKKELFYDVIEKNSNKQAHTEN